MAAVVGVEVARLPRRREMVVGRCRGGDNDIRGSKSGAGGGRCGRARAASELRARPCPHCPGGLKKKKKRRGRRVGKRGRR